MKKPDKNGKVQITMKFKYFYQFYEIECLLLFYGKFQSKWIRLHVSWSKNDNFFEKFLSS